MGRLVAIIAVLPLVYLLAIVIASEWGGEVVTLDTYDVRGRKLETSVWIVQMQGDLWLRASDPEAAWLQRLRAEPLVFVTRGGQRKEYRAQVSEEHGPAINHAMREKYGRADQLIATLNDPDEVVAIRLSEP